jgi:glycine cleavage system aminomethyltransferase T
VIGMAWVTPAEAMPGTRITLRSDAVDYSANVVEEVFYDPAGQRLKDVMEAQRQSALHRCHLEAQAHLQTFFGWQLPAWYTDPSSELEAVRASVGISDASYLFKLDLRGEAGALQVAAPARLWQLTPAHALITSPLPIGFAASASVTDVTSVYSAILLAGPKSREVLQKLTTLNVREGAMAEGAARQTRLAHVNATDPAQ